MVKDPTDQGEMVDLLREIKTIVDSHETNPPTQSQVAQVAIPDIGSKFDDLKEYVRSVVGQLSKQLQTIYPSVTESTPKSLVLKMEETKLYSPPVEHDIQTPQGNDVVLIRSIDTKIQEVCEDNEFLKDRPLEKGKVENVAEEKIAETSKDNNMDTNQ
ncbi:hypothetical protein RFI_04660, partial [Reticulomyxa filosa]